MAQFKGDNTGAFNNRFIEIDLENPDNYVVKKAIFICGCLKKEYDNPIFPIYVNYNEEESKRFNFKNTCYLVVWDEQGRQKTCEGTLTFEAKNGVYNG